MIIYAEYLFFENFLSGLFLLHATARLRGLTPNKIRLLFGGMICGLYSFILFLKTHSLFFSLTMRFCFSLFLLIGVFLFDGNIISSLKDKRFWRTLAKLVIVFYISSFAMGGVVIGLLYLLSVPAITYEGGFYIGSLSYWHVYGGMFLGWQGLLILSSYMKSFLHKSRTSMDVEITFSGKSVVLKGMVDTGNFLIDPLTGKPVFLISEEALSVFPQKDWYKRYRYIPYKSIGNPGASLTGIRPDKITLIESSERRSTDAILAIYNGDFLTEYEDKYQLLLHPYALKDNP